MIETAADGEGKSRSATLETRRHSHGEEKTQRGSRQFRGFPLEEGHPGGGTTPATSPTRISGGSSRRTPRPTTRRTTPTTSGRSTSRLRRRRRRRSTTCTSTGRRSRTRPSGSTSDTTRSRATSCSTRSAARAGRPCLPCWTDGRPSPSIEARPPRSSPRIIAPPWTLTNLVGLSEVRQAIRAEIDWLYETRCDRCGGRAMTGYTVYSQMFQCPRCLSKVPLYDCGTEDSQTAAGKPKSVNVCPTCRANGFTEVIRSQSEKFGFIPVKVVYHCENGCKPTRDVREHSDTGEKGTFSRTTIWARSMRSSPRKSRTGTRKIAT